jgi:plasmid stabilization system protein ParE
MADVAWTKRAAAELDAIVQRIATNSPLNAGRFPKAPFGRRIAWQRFPWRARLSKNCEFSMTARSCFGSNRILYQGRGDTCYIVFMIHGSRELRNAFDPLRDLPGEW